MTLMNDDDDEGKKPFQCSLCDTNFLQVTDLVIHVDSVHKGEKPYQCSSCDSKFEEEIDLKTHFSN